MTDERTDRPLHDPTEAPLEHPEDAGAYIGQRPERQAETIPGGVRPDDARIAAHSSSPAPVTDESEDAPVRREAGKDR